MSSCGWLVGLRDCCLEAPAWRLTRPHCATSLPHPPSVSLRHRGQSQYRGVTRHHQANRWEARIGKVCVCAAAGVAAWLPAGCMYAASICSGNRSVSVRPARPGICNRSSRTDRPPNFRNSLCRWSVTSTSTWAASIPPVGCCCCCRNRLDSLAELSLQSTVRFHGRQFPLRAAARRPSSLPTAPAACHAPPTAEEAARAYDRACVKYRGAKASALSWRGSCAAMKLALQLGGCAQALRMARLVDAGGTATSRFHLLHVLSMFSSFPGHPQLRPVALPRHPGRSRQLQPRQAPSVV